MFIASTLMSNIKAAFQIVMTVTMMGIFKNIAKRLNLVVTQVT